MTHRTYSVVLALLIVLSSVAALAETTQLISWSEDLVLGWSMYTATVPAGANPHQPAQPFLDLKWDAPTKAVTCSGGYLATPQFVVVSNTLNPRLSWARLGEVTAADLRHEEYHFRLNEVYRRKLEGALLPLQATDRNPYTAMEFLREQLEQAAAPILSQAQAIQNQYESETNFGRDVAAQQSWEAQIDAWLLNPASAP